MRLSSSRVLSGTLKLASSAGAIAAVLALAGTAWTGEHRSQGQTRYSRSIPPYKYRALALLTLSFPLTSAGSIRSSTSTSWLTATTRRSTSSIRRTTASNNSSTRDSRATPVTRGAKQRHLRSRRRIDRTTTRSFGSETARGKSGYSMPKMEMTISWAPASLSASAGQPEPMNSASIRIIM